MENFFESENFLSKKYFNLDEILIFQLNHDVQIIRGDDYQYQCFIDKNVYATSLTPIFALWYGIKKFKKKHENES